MTVALSTVDSLDVTVRPLGRARGEAEFVRETTLKVRWPRREGVTWRAWEAQHAAQVAEWVQDGRCFVATSAETIIGFALWTGPALAMLYVKQGLRGNGVGLRLLETLPPGATQVIQPTPCWKRWAQYHGIAWEVAR